MERVLAQISFSQIFDTSGPLDPQGVAGTIRIAPLINLPGYREKSRYFPDGRDINRNFQVVPLVQPQVEGLSSLSIDKRYRCHCRLTCCSQRKIEHAQIRADLRIPNQTY